MRAAKLIYRAEAQSKQARETKMAAGGSKSTIASLLERILVPENNTNGSAPRTRVPSASQTALQALRAGEPKSTFGHSATHVLMSSPNVFSTPANTAPTSSSTPNVDGP